MALYTASELKKKTVGDLKDLIDQHDIEAEDDWKKQDLIDALLEVEESEDDELEDDEVDDIEEEEEAEDDELDDEEDDLEVDEVEDEAPKKPAKKSTKKPAKVSDPDTMAAKQVATELGTEAKTLRQFFRSPASTVEAVGSGGRYEFNKDDLPKIKAEFETWKASHGTRTKSAEGGTTRRSRKAKDAPAVEIEEVEELEIEELDLDDDELDDDELED